MEKDDGNEPPTKKTKREDENFLKDSQLMSSVPIPAESAQLSSSAPAAAPAAAPEQSLEQTQTGISQGNDDEADVAAAADTEIHKIDAEKFLFRSPASPAEIQEIANKIRDRIDGEIARISELGYEAYKKMRQGGNSSTTGAGTDNGTTNDDENDYGVDTDDEMIQDRKTKERAAALEEAIVRGNPRRYQTALVELAKKQNTIVHLGTGQGKTLIGLLLIRHFAHVNQKGEPWHAYENGQQTLFLVPSVALATQHTTTLQANLPYTVATACHNSTKANGSRESMAEANILVATHGAARDLFMHYGDLFSFNKINLLIVDECHYASGEHGYSTIMRNFYHRLPLENRPRVLGLTASPLVNIKSDVDDEKLGMMLRELEERLDSRLACLSRIYGDGVEGNGDKDGGMDCNRKQAEERCVHFHRASNMQQLPSHEDIGLYEGRVKEFNQFIDLYNDLGPKLTSIYSATVAREISMNRYDEETKEEFLV